MISKVYKAIAAECKKICGQCRIYRNNIPQDFKLPCFLVLITDTTAQRKLDNSQQMTVDFDLEYFPEGDIKDQIYECEIIKQEMLRAFDVITADGISFYVREKTARITDNVLHFFFSISYREKLVTDEPLMEELDTKIREE